MSVSTETMTPETGTDLTQERAFVLLYQQGYLACPLEDVREILNPASLTLTPIPNTFQCVQGLFNLRGDLLPVIDLGYLIYQHRNRGTQPNRILVLELWAGPQGAFQRLGLLVEQIFQVVNCPVERIQKLSQAQTSVEIITSGLKPFISAICQPDDQTLWPVLSSKSVMTSQLWL